MYGLHRAEFENIVNLFNGISETIIFSCHVKDSSIPKDGNQLAVTDIKLTGSLKEIFSAKQDAACLLEIDKDNKNTRLLNFEKTEQNSFVKCRAEHLKNKKIKISEMTDKGLVTYWDQIFLDLTNSKK